MTAASDLIEAAGSLLAAARDAFGFAHDLGHALPSLDDDALRELRNRLAELELPDPQLDAVATTLVEIVDGYRLGRQRTVTFSLHGIHREVARALEQRAATTGELAEQLSRDESQISRALARLRAHDLVESLGRDAIDRRRIEHRLTIAARQALSRLAPEARRAQIWQLAPFGAAPERAISVEEEPALPALIGGPLAKAPAAASYSTARGPAPRINKNSRGKTAQRPAPQASARPPRAAPPSAIPSFSALAGLRKK